MKIPDHKIDEIRSATDIVDVIGAVVRLRKRGKNHLGLCPFHKEKTPSFNVSAERQMYHCFGCGAGGNVFTFLMQFEKLSFVEAVRALAKNAGIDLPEPGESSEGTTEQDRAHALLRLAAQHYHENLTGSQEGKLALEYLHHRGISDGTIRQFGLGYSLHSWDAFLGFSRGHGYAPDVVEKYGLARKRDDGGHYDYFRGRVMFPILTAVGKVVGFGARKLREDDPLGKYINSPESPLYNKSRILYGVFHSKEAIRAADSAVLVEGYLDLISLHQEGIKNVIASSGTALTVEQTQLVRRYTRNMTIMYDADSAGSKAAMRGVDVVLAQDMDVRVAKLPEGDDPDTFVRKSGAAGFAKLLEGSLSFVDAIIDARKGAGDSPEERSKTVRMLVRTIAQMPDALKRDLYVKHIAATFALRENVLQGELETALRSSGASASREGGWKSSRAAPGGDEPEGRQAAPSSAGSAADPDRRVPAEERDLFTAVLRGGENVARFVLGHVAAEEYRHPAARGLAELISSRLEEGESLEPAALVDAAVQTEAGEEIREFISSISLPPVEPEKPQGPGTLSAVPGDPLRIAADAALAVKRRNLRELLWENRELLRRASEQGGDVDPYQKRHILLNEELSRLDKEGLAH